MNRAKSLLALNKVLRSRKPVSDVYGLDRGRAIDRFYIEEFLSRNSEHIRGHCLELLNNNYTKQFGGTRVLESDILDINRENTDATIYGDLRKLKSVQAGTYDCIILTQVLQFIDDYEAGVKECQRILRPGGVLLATLPAISRADVASGVEADFWRFTSDGSKYLFSKVFGGKNIKVESHGNILSGLAFWVGLAQEDLSKKDLTYNDSSFPMLITVRAKKA